MTGDMLSTIFIAFVVVSLANLVWQNCVRPVLAKRKAGLRYRLIYNMTTVVLTHDHGPVIVHLDHATKQLRPAQSDLQDVDDLPAVIAAADIIGGQSQLDNVIERLEFLNNGKKDK